MASPLNTPAPLTDAAPDGATSGAGVDSGRFSPFAAAFLTAGRPFDFEIFMRGKVGRLFPVVAEGESLSAVQCVEVGNLAGAERLYIHADQRNLVLRYQEDRLPHVLKDTHVPLIDRCCALKNLLGFQEAHLFENPHSLALYRLRETVTQLLDFLRAEPSAIKELLAMAYTNYTGPTHSVNVGLYATALALEHLGRATHHEWIDLSLAFFVHDIGRASVREHVRTKPGALDEPEWWEMRKHPAYGHRLLERAKALTPEMAAVVLQHHERMDGHGYPYGLAGADVHPYARICAVADAFDALTTNRSFRGAVDPFDSLRIMRDEMHSQFDPMVFKTFVVMLKSSESSDGAHGKLSGAQLVQ